MLMQDQNIEAASETNASCFKFGIRLIRDDVEHFRANDAIEFSSGIVRAKLQYEALPYWVRAFAPKLPWRKPSDSELDLLLGSIDAAEPGKWIQVIKIPEKITSLFESARIASREPTDQKLREYTASAACREAIQQTVEFASSLAWPEHPKVDRGGVFFKAPGLPTTTPRNYPELLGLHIDTAYKDVPFEGRNYAPGRISINLGLDDRFLLFVSASLDEIRELLAERKIQYPEEPSFVTHEFRSAFMSNFPDFPVVKVRIRPGEAYIAPTENLIHDGCTLGQTHFDVQFSACGHFQPQCSSTDSGALAFLSMKLRKDERASPLQKR